VREGQIALTPIPQADGNVKNRPVILLRELPGFKDFLVCGVSSQVRHEIKGFDEIIRANDDDFKGSGLHDDSLIRLGFLAVVPQRNLLGAIGEISVTRHKHLLQKLSDYLIENCTR